MKVASVLSVLTCCLLAACSTVDTWNQVFPKGARATVSGVNINWSVEERLGRPSTGMYFARFEFSETTRGFGQYSRLSLDRRERLAERVVNRHPYCRWAGHDETTDRPRAFQLGSVDKILVARVRCTAPTD